MKLKNTEAASEVITPSAFVSLDVIASHEDLHYRKVNAEFVKELAADIAVNGLDTPLSTWGGGEEQQKVKVKGETVDAHWLIAGLHRRAALLQFRRDNADGFKKMFPHGIPVMHRCCNVADALALQVRENVQRREMEPAEIFPVLEELKNEHGLKNREIAKKIGKSDTWVSQMMSVNDELDEDTKKEVVEGKIGISKAVKLAASVTKDKKAGKTVTKEDIRAKASEAKAETEGGRERAVKRLSPAKFYARYHALPTVPMGRKIVILENALAYIAGETNKLEPEWKVEEKKSAVKPAKKK